MNCFHNSSSNKIKSTISGGLYFFLFLQGLVSICNEGLKGEITMYNPFIKQNHEYTRDINIISSYVEQQAYYLSKMTNRDYNFCHKWVLDKIKHDEELKLKDPTVYYLSRENQRDRIKAVMPLSQYISSVQKNNYVMVPTFTVYAPEEKIPSLYTSYIQRKKKERKHHKQLMFKASMEGNKDVEQAENNNQQAKKIRINSLSGAALQAFTISYNASLHPTLTSVCRISTSYANANNEKFMGGNRAYFSEKSTLDNVVFLAMTADKDTIVKTIEEFNLDYPTLEQAIECVKWSSDLYWSKHMSIRSVEDFLAKCEPFELANIVYNGDLFHLAKFNPHFITKFINDFIDYEPCAIDNAAEWIEKIADEHTVSYVSLICSEMLIGKQLQTVKKETPDTYAKIGDVCRHTFEMMQRYGQFIETFLRPEYLTSEIYDIEAMVRRVVITSDTDSTIFTTQHWTHFMTGSYNFDPKSYKVGYYMTFLSSQMTRHLLATMSCSIGIKEKNLNGISMKSEYFFPVYVITPAAKHYYAYISAREGNVYEKNKIEVKGVNLRTSKLPDTSMEPFRKHLINTLDTIIKSNGITLEEIISEPIRVETSIRQSLESGKTEYLSRQELKDSTAYTKGEDAANYKYHLFFQEVFAPKYGNAPELPYKGVKISTKLVNKTALAKWVATIEDQQLAQRLADYITRNNKTSMTTFYIPEQMFLTEPIPKEMLQVLDVESLLIDLTSPWYMYLESMGFYIKNDRNTRLISDEFRLVYNPTNPV